MELIKSKSIGTTKIEGKYTSNKIINMAKTHLWKPLGLQLSINGNKDTRTTDEKHLHQNPI